MSARYSCNAYFSETLAFVVGRFIFDDPEFPGIFTVDDDDAEVRCL